MSFTVPQSVGGDDHGSSSASPHPARPSHLTRNEIYQLAERFARELELRTPVDARALLSTLGGRIGSLDSARFEGLQATLLVDGLRRFTVRLPEEVGPRDERFFIGHELGHYLLHYPLAEGQSMFAAAPAPTDRAEHEANWFSLGLLVTNSELEHALEGIEAEKLTYHIGDLADRFGISDGLMAVRIQHWQRRDCGDV